MPKLPDLNIKYVQDENYKLSDEDIKNNVQVVLIKPGEKDSNGADICENITYLGKYLN